MGTVAADTVAAYVMAFKIGGCRRRGGAHRLLLVLMELLQQALRGQVALNAQRGHAARAGRRDGLAPLHVVQVARRKHALHARLHAVVHLRART